MLTSFGISNFKVFGALQRFDLAPITLIYGPNSGGKSSIIQALLLLKQSVEAPINQGLRDRVLIPKGLYADLGQSKSIHHKHCFDNHIIFEVGVSVSQPITRMLSPIFSENDEIVTTLRFEHRDSGRSKLPAVAEIKYHAVGKRHSVLDMTLIREVRTGQKPSEELDLEDTNEVSKATNFFNFATAVHIQNFNEFLRSVPSVRAQELQKNFFGLDPSSDPREKNRFQVGFRPSVTGKTNYLPTTVRNLANPNPKAIDTNGVLDIPSRALFQVARAFNVQFESMSYLGPLRSRPRRLYELSQQYQGSIGSSGEYAVDALTTDMSTGFRGEQSVVEYVNTWLERFEIPYTVAVDEVGNEVLGDLAMLKLRDNRTGIWVAATDVGFGIGQLLPVIIEGALAARANGVYGREKTICVEQPEIHLHPRLQANVADFLIATAKKNNCQWVIETHSEALMLRIQKRIREGALQAKSVSVVFVEPCGETGSRIVNLRLDDQGNFIDEWPGGFFEESFSEMFF